MVPWESIKEGITVLLVVIAISITVTLAWISTRVRELPVMATAVLVFQQENGMDSSSQQTGGSDGQQRASENSQEVDSPTETASPVEEGVVEEKRCVSPNSSTIEELHKDVPTNEKDVVECVTSSKSVENNTAECASSNNKNEISVSSCMSSEDNANVSKSSEKSVKDGKQSNLSAKESDDTEVSQSSYTLTKDIKVSLPKEEPSEIDRESKKSNEDGELGAGAVCSSSISEEILDRSGAQRDIELTGSAVEMEVRRRRLHFFMNMGSNDTSDSSASETKPDKPQATLVASEESQQEQGDEADLEPLEDRPPGSIRIRLKFLDDTQRFVHAQLADEVGSFKRQHFALEIEANRLVRLIFNGQLLSQDGSTLGQYGLFDNCVVHCHVSQPRPRGSTSARTSADLHNDGADLDLSGLLVPLLLTVVVFLWYLRYEYSHLFNTTATVILVCITSLLLVSQYALTITLNFSVGTANGTTTTNATLRAGNVQPPGTANPQIPTANS